MQQPHVQQEAQRDEPFYIHIENKTGRATMKSFAIFPGIQVNFIDGHINTISCYAQPRPGVFAINHCHTGRAECAFSNGTFLYMGPGDMSIGWRRSSDYCHMLTFPSSRYDGLSIIFDTFTCQAYIDKLLGTNKVDLQTLCNRFCVDSDFGMIVQADDELQETFKEFYSISDGLKSRYIRERIGELLLYLNTLPIRCQQQETRKVKLRQVAIVKAIHDQLVGDLRKHPTIIELSEQYGISQTNLKKIFRYIYGDSILQYIKTYRMERAKELLRKDEMPIGLISLLVGYENPSKFTDSFSRIVGCVPRDYREAARQGLI